MTKMDKIWISVATLLHPQDAANNLVTYKEIIVKIDELFNIVISPVMLEKHLVSIIDRQANRRDKRQGGARNRYLFRSLDGKTPNASGYYRLYKALDQKYDAWDKTGKTHPFRDDIDKEYNYLLNWYIESYFDSI